MGGDAPAAMHMPLSFGNPRFETDHRGAPCLGGCCCPCAWLVTLVHASGPEGLQQCSVAGAAAVQHDAQPVSTHIVPLASPVGRPHLPHTPAPRACLLLSLPAVADCIVNSEMLERAAEYRPLKFFLIQLALGHTAQQVGAAAHVACRFAETRCRDSLRGRCAVFAGAACSAEQADAAAPASCVR